MRIKQNDRQHLNYALFELLPHELKLQAVQPIISKLNGNQIDIRSLWDNAIKKHWYYFPNYIP